MLRNEYEIAYLSGKYEKALEILDNIDGVICVSLWSLGQRFLIKELRDGLEENKKLLSKIADEVNDDIILCILYYYSSMAESGLSFDNYQTEAMKFIKTLGDSVLGKYICNKLSLESVYQHSDISLTIQLDSQISLIDLFITLEKCLPVHYKNQICDGSALNLPYGVENIKCRLFDNLRVLLRQDIDYSSCHNEQNEKIYEIIECYTAGQYAIVNEKAICYLEKYPNDFQVAVLLCKALILDKKEFPHVLSAHYAKYIYSIYKLDSGYKEAVIQLKHELKRNHGLILGIKIYAFLCRKNIMRGTASNVFVSSILDPCVHPNFSRFLFEAPMNAFTGKMICYSPLAVRLSLSERTGDFDGIKGIVANRAYFLTQAKAYSKNGEFCKAQYILDEYSVLLRKVSKLSGGWQRRVSIAMALISEPKVLFLDEPTLGLDVIARHDLWDLIRSLKGKITIILTTHYMEEAQSLSDRIGIMKNGCLLAVGTAEELAKRAGAKDFETAFMTIVKEDAV